MNVSVNPVPSSEEGAERRVHPRVAVAMPAFLQVRDMRLSVHIVDLSAGGAKIRCGETLCADTSVILDCGSLRCSAVTRWQGGGFIGICFDRPIEERVIDALVVRSQALAQRIAAR